MLQCLLCCLEWRTPPNLTATDCSARILLSTPAFASNPQAAMFIQHIHTSILPDARLLRIKKTCYSYKQTSDKLLNEMNIDWHYTTVDMCMYFKCNLFSDSSRTICLSLSLLLWSVVNSTSKEPSQIATLVQGQHSMSMAVEGAQYFWPDLKADTYNTCVWWAKLESNNQWRGVWHTANISHPMGENKALWYDYEHGQLNYSMTEGGYFTVEWTPGKMQALVSTSRLQSHYFC